MGVRLFWSPQMLAARCWCKGGHLHTGGALGEPRRGGGGVDVQSTARRKAFCSIPPRATRTVPPVPAAPGNISEQPPAHPQ